MSKKKKIIVLSSMIALLAVTAVFNFVIAGNDSMADTTSVSYFVEYKSERSSSRNEQILQLDKIISESEVNSEVRETALTQKLQLTALTEQELRYESLIKAHGYDEVVVTMNLSSPNVNVVVRDSDFDQADAVKIYSILTKDNVIDAENINIIPYL